MKNKFHPAFIALLFTVVFTQFSCSKDTLEPAGGRSGSNTPSTNRNITDFQQYDYDALTTGALVLQVTPPEAKAVVTVFNDTYTSGPYAMNAMEGILRLDNLEPGMYKVQIRPINTEYLPKLIEDVEIIADSKTNLGTIILGN